MAKNKPAHRGLSSGQVAGQMAPPVRLPLESGPRTAAAHSSQFVPDPQLFLWQKLIQFPGIFPK